jgi:nicotinate dehydrogenase subunit A
METEPPSPLKGGSKAMCTRTAGSGPMFETARKKSPSSKTKSTRTSGAGMVFFSIYWPRMPQYKFRVNERMVSVDSWDAEQPLLYVLRNQLGLHGAKFGCGLGQCGACSVLLDGKVTRACMTPVRQAAGRAVTTIEGLGTPEKPDAVSAAFIEEQAAQCGYCTNGMVLAAKALLRETPHPTREQVQQSLAGNLCRCGTHTRILNAVLRAAKA